MNKVRKCKSCGKDNPPTRYFKCYECQPEIESDDIYTYPESYDYGTITEFDTAARRKK